MNNRARGNAKMRLGFRPDATVAFRGEVDTLPNQGNHRIKTPLQRAREELSKALDAYDDSDVLKKEITSEAVRLDTITTMNMNTLAAVFMYLREFPEPTPDDFTDEILDPYLNQLMQDFLIGAKTGDPQEQADVRHRYKQTMLRYIIKIITLRTPTNPQDEEVIDEVIEE